MVDIINCSPSIIDFGEIQIDFDLPSAQPIVTEQAEHHDSRPNNLILVKNICVRFSGGTWILDDPSNLQLRLLSIKHTRPSGHHGWKSAVSATIILLLDLYGVRYSELCPLLQTLSFYNREEEVTAAILLCNIGNEDQRSPVDKLH